MVALPHIYDSLVEFMARLDPVQVVGFHAPASMQAQLEALLEKKQTGLISPAEQEELDHFLIVEHIVRLAKSRARMYLASAEA